MGYALRSTEAVCKYFFLAAILFSVYLAGFRGTLAAEQDVLNEQDPAAGSPANPEAEHVEGTSSSSPSFAKEDPSIGEQPSHAQPPNEGHGGGLADILDPTQEVVNPSAASLPSSSSTGGDASPSAQDVEGCGGKEQESRGSAQEDAQQLGGSSPSASAAAEEPSGTLQSYAASSSSGGDKAGELCHSASSSHKEGPSFGLRRLYFSLRRHMNKGRGRGAEIETTALRRTHSAEAGTFPVIREEGSEAQEHRRRAGERPYPGSVGCNYSMNSTSASGIGRSAGQPFAEGGTASQSKGAAGQDKDAGKRACLLDSWRRVLKPRRKARPRSEMIWGSMGTLSELGGADLDERSPRRSSVPVDNAGEAGGTSRERSTSAANAGKQPKTWGRFGTFFTSMFGGRGQPHEVDVHMYSYQRRRLPVFDPVEHPPPQHSERHMYFLNPRCEERPLRSATPLEELELIRECLEQLRAGLRANTPTLRPQHREYQSAMEDMRFFLERAAQLEATDFETKMVLSQRKRTP